MHVRLLVVSNLYPPVVRGGYEVECRDVVEHLSRVHDVTVLASSLGAEDAPADPSVLRRLPWTGDMRKTDSLLTVLHARRAAAAVVRTVAETRPDALYVWNAAGMPSAALRALQLTGVPMLVRVCEYWFGGIYRHDSLTRYLPGGSRAPGSKLRAPEALWATAIRLLAASPVLPLDWTTPLPAAVCWNSGFVAAAAPAPPSFAVVHRDIVIPSNARTAQLAFVPRLPVPGRLLFVGRLDERKGAATVVRALELLRKRGATDAHLHVVGDGTNAERQGLQSVSRRCGVSSQVRFLGPLQGADLYDEISHASAWCVPSVWDEPAPLTCTEAVLSRVPAVFSRVGGIPEMYIDEEHALFHDRSDAAGCAAALERVLAGGPDVQARTARALRRGQELSFGPYLAAMDRFLATGLEALTDATRTGSRRT